MKTVLDQSKDKKFNKKYINIDGVIIQVFRSSKFVQLFTVTNQSKGTEDSIFKIRSSRCVIKLKKDFVHESD